MSFLRVSTTVHLLLVHVHLPALAPSLARARIGGTSVFGSHRWNDGTVLDRGRCGRARLNRINLVIRVTVKKIVRHSTYLSWVHKNVYTRKNVLHEDHVDQSDHEDY